MNKQEITQPVTADMSGQDFQKDMQPIYRRQTLSNSIFEFILEYQDSPLFKWIRNHPKLSITIVSVWGIVILVIFFVLIIRIITKLV